ncbi:hypothetical protein B0H11DRAFT_1614230, partial [Mycena galericulata]
AFQHATIVVWYILGAVLHLLCGISEQHCRFILSSANVLHTLYQPPAEATASEYAIPADVRTLLDRLAIHPTTQSFVCCPRCFFLYDMDRGVPDSYPERCTNHDTPDGPVCNRRLRKL